MWFIFLYVDMNQNVLLSYCNYNTVFENNLFLNLDHIQGREKMNSFKELKEIGYDSDVRDKSLQIWIKNNNYLSNLETEYFQILCHNCNVAKGIYGKCPHEK